MKRSHALYAVVATLIATIVITRLLTVSAIHPKCDVLAMTSDLQNTLEFHVARNNIETFNKTLVTYLEKDGFSVETSRSPTYLSPPDANGNQELFTNIKTIGCTYRTIVWSENVIKHDEFIVTVHSSIFGNKSLSDRTSRNLREKLGITVN